MVSLYNDYNSKTVVRNMSTRDHVNIVTIN